MTAFGEYALYVNGRFVGTGPSPSTFEEPLLDVYTEADLPLVRGRNVIAILAHYSYLSLPRRPRASAGLWVDLELTGARGGVTRIVSDGRWRVAPAADFSDRAPRIHWSAGFTEVRDLRRQAEGWTQGRFRDAKWAAADEVRPSGPEGSGPPRPRERPLPRLVETFVAPAAVVGAGRMNWPAGTTAIPFEFTVPSASHGEFYAATFVRSDGRRKARLVYDCDEASAVYVNNRQAIRQGPREEFIDRLDAGEQNDYIGIHRGQGQRVETADVELDEGWNSVGVVIYDPGTAWGFAMRFEEPRSGRPMDLPFSPDQKPQAHGRLADRPGATLPLRRRLAARDARPQRPHLPRPGVRTGLGDAVRRPRRRRRRHPAGQGFARRSGAPPWRSRGQGAGAASSSRTASSSSTTSGARPSAPSNWKWMPPPGPSSTWPGPRPPARRASSRSAQALRQVDRLILSDRPETVRFFSRRALRYLELVARTGGGAVTVRRLGVRATSREAEPPPVPETPDRALRSALALCSSTVHACVQDIFEGSPAREAEQSIPAAFLLSQAQRLLLGRADMGEAALRAFAADQDGDGFFRAVVPAGTVHVVPDWNLLWIIWLADHVCLDRRPTPGRRPVPRGGPGAGLDGILPRFDGPAWRTSPTACRGGCSWTSRPPTSAAWSPPGRRCTRGPCVPPPRWPTPRLSTRPPPTTGPRPRPSPSRPATICGNAERGLFADARLYEHLSPAASAAANYYALYGGLADRRAGRPHPLRPLGRRLHRDRRSESGPVPGWGPYQNPFVKYFALSALLERGQVGAGTGDDPLVLGHDGPQGPGHGGRGLPAARPPAVAAA